MQADHPQVDFEAGRPHWAAKTWTVSSILFECRFGCFLCSSRFTALFYRSADQNWTCNFIFAHMIFSERVKYLRGVCYPSLPQHCARRSGTLLEPIARFRLVALWTQAFLSEVWPELFILSLSALNLYIMNLLGFSYHFPFISFSPSGGGACFDLLSFFSAPQAAVVWISV